MICDRCAAIYINGLLCHETGCPITRTNKCIECGDRFRAANPIASVCDDCMADDRAFYGNWED
jgi:hypothetical protein